MINYASNSNNTAGCHIRPRFPTPGELAGFTIATAEPSRAEPTRVQTRLVEAGLPVDRFVDLRDRTKESTVDHTDPVNQFAPETVTGNYGVMAGRGLLIIDIDDPDAVPDWLTHLLETQPTLTVSSPHGDETQSHHFYHLSETTELEKATLTRDWGSILLDRAYAVGPGSALDHDDYCGNDCSMSGVGRYEIHHDRPIATIQFSAIQDVLPVESNTDSPTSSPPAPTDLDSRIERGLETNPKFRDLWTWARDGGPPADVGFPDDRSGAEAALSAHLHFWLSGDAEAVREAFDRVNPPKWRQRAESYRQSILAAGDNGDYYNPERTSRDISLEAITEVTVTLQLAYDGQASTAEIVEHDWVTVQREQTRKVLDLLEKRGYIHYERDGRTGIWVVDDPEGLLEDTVSSEIEEEFNSRLDWLAWCRRNL